MLPAAPPRFSTITDCPSDARRRSVKMRASTSAGPAAGNGTTIVIGRVGKACAAALRSADGTTAAAAVSCRNWRRGRFIPCFPRNGRGAAPPALLRERGGELIYPPRVQGGREGQS